MRRTSVGKLICKLGDERPWATIPCDAVDCVVVGITILASSVTENGAIELCFCGPVCARLSGWPWLTSERSSPKPPRAVRPPTAGAVAHG